MIVIEAAGHKLGELTEKIESMGCSWDSMQQRYLSIDVPPASDIKSLTAYLKNGEEQGDWSFQESAIWPDDD